MLIFEQLTRRAIVFVFALSIMLNSGCLSYSIGYAQEKETGSTSEAQNKPDEGWLSDWQERVEEGNVFYSYAVKLFKEPLKHTAELTPTFDNYQAGILRFSLRGGVSFKLKKSLQKVQFPD